VERLEHELVELVDVRGGSSGVGGFSAIFGQGVSWRTGARRRARCFASVRNRRYQLGSCARMAVAEVGSGGRRRKKIAGALHSVQCLAWPDGWTNRLSQPSARTARARES